MKLSKSQQSVIESLKNKIDFARSASLYEWVRKAYFTRDNVTDSEVEKTIENDKKVFGYDYIRKSYEDTKAGTTIVMCNSKTLYKLQEYGLIEIIKDSKGETYGVDVVKLLNY